MFFHSTITSLADQKSVHSHCWFGGLLVGEVGGGSGSPCHSCLSWNWNPHRWGCVLRIVFVCFTYTLPPLDGPVDMLRCSPEPGFQNLEDLNPSSFLTGEVQNCARGCVDYRILKTRAQQTWWNSQPQICDSLVYVFSFFITADIFYCLWTGGILLLARRKD